MPEGMRQLTREEAAIMQLQVLRQRIALLREKLREMKQLPTLDELRAESVIQARKPEKPEPGD